MFQGILSIKALRDNSLHEKRWIKNGIPYGIRTRVARSKIWSPKPLDEGDLFFTKSD